MVCGIRLLIEGERAGKADSAPKLAVDRLFKCLCSCMWTAEEVIERFPLCGSQIRGFQTVARFPIYLSRPRQMSSSSRKAGHTTFVYIRNFVSNDAFKKATAMQDF